MHAEEQAKHFDTLATTSDLNYYNDSPEYCQRITNELILDTMRSFPNGSILEIGAGKGQYTLLLLKHGFNVTANDISEGALRVLSDQATKYGLDKKLKMLAGDICKTEENHGPYDIIFFADTFHHLEYEQTITILSAIKPLLRKNGLLVAWEPNGNYPFWRQMHLINRDFEWDYEKNITHCTHKAFIDKLTRAGWTLEKYINHRILPIALLDKSEIFRIMDNYLMKMPFISTKSAYSLIIATPTST